MHSDSIHMHIYSPIINKYLIFDHIDWLNGTARRAHQPQHSVSSGTKFNCGAGAYVFRMFLLVLFSVYNKIDTYVLCCIK